MTQNQRSHEMSNILQEIMELSILGKDTQAQQKEFERLELEFYSEGSCDEYSDGFETLVHNFKNYKAMKKSDYKHLTNSLHALHKQMMRTISVMAKAVNDEQHPNLIELAGAARMIKEWIEDINHAYEKSGEVIEP